VRYILDALQIMDNVQCNTLICMSMILDGVWVDATLIQLVTIKDQTPWPVVRKLTIPTERPPLVGEVSAKFCG
jgi:hypothetical protein